MIYNNIRATADSYPAGLSQTIGENLDSITLAYAPDAISFMD